MGGQGSGRTPNVETLLRGPENKTPIAEELFIPNYSGLQPVKKTDPTIGSGTETDPVFLALSDSLAYEPTLTKGDLEASGSGITIYNGTGAVIGTGTKISVEGAGDEADPKFFALSNSIATYMPMSLSNSSYYFPMSLSHSAWYFPMSLSTSLAYLPLSLSNSLTYIPLSLSSSWNTDLASGSAHFADSSDPHGATLTQTNIYGTYISGSSISGSTIKVLADNDASGSAICRNILVGTEATPGPANLYTQGSVYLKYTA